MTPLAWELNWIDNNILCYRSIAHAEQVKRNIANRYRRNAIISKLRSLRAAARLLK